MAASGSNAATGDLLVDNLISGCGKVSTFGKPVGVHFSYRSLHNCQKAGIGLKSHETISRHSICTGYDVTRTSGNSISLVRPLFGLSNSSFRCYSHGVPDVTFHGSAFDGELADSAVSADRSILVDTTLKLQSGSCYLPHPDKEKTGGEDAHFICEEEHVIGIADGVGGWADVGVNAGIYARELMSNSFAAIRDEPKGSIDPARVLEKAHSVTQSKGSSTACIIALIHQLQEPSTLQTLLPEKRDSAFLARKRDGSAIPMRGKRDPKEDGSLSVISGRRRRYSLLAVAVVMLGVKEKWKTKTRGGVRAWKTIVDRG